MSDVSQGPGWWIASDGRWYPPELHPSAPVAPVAAPTMSALPSMPAAPPAGGRSRRMPRRSLVLLGGAAVLAVVLVIVLVLGSGSVTDRLADGHATGMITVTVPSSGQPTFTGTLDGRALNGTVSGPKDKATSAGFNPTFTYSGQYDGTGYRLDVSIDLSKTRSSLGTGLHVTPMVYFSVTGSYGSSAVNASARLASLSSLSPAIPVSFSGTVGSQKLTGVATARDDPGHSIDITATFVVS